MNKRILIASPINQKPDILRYFLESLNLLDKTQLLVDFLFVDDNEEEEPRKLLEDFQRSQPVTLWRNPSESAYRRDENTHYWTHGLTEKVGRMKDAIIEYALKESYEALFLVDSDLLLHPNTLQRLLGEKKEIISNIFWTRWQPGTAPLPQVWMMDEYLFYQKTDRGHDDEEATRKTSLFLEQMRTPGVYEVGGLGACTLISRDAMEQGVRFHRLPNLSFWGEDRHFSIRSAALGIPLHVDTRYPAYHIYRETDLEGAAAFMKSVQGSRGAKPITISLCMIVRDEEEALPQCLVSAQGIADEIIIVDTGSTDRTKEAAGAFTDLIYDYEWNDDFAAARNFAFSKATKDYILWLDADDKFREEDRLAFISLKAKLLPEVDSVMMYYNLVLDEKGLPTSRLKRNRLVKRTQQYRWIGAVHEYLEVSGHIEQSEIAVTHAKNKAHTDRNLRIYRSREKQGEAFPPRDLYYYANELRDHAKPEEAVIMYERFLDTRAGWIEDQIAACRNLADCYTQLQQRDKSLGALYRSMTLDLPRAEVCCDLGAIFMGEDRFHQAIYWFEAAAGLGDPPKSGALVDQASWTWLPYLQLCVCYDRLGQIQKAHECNERALALCPDHPSMLFNRKYFQERLKDTGRPEE
ncbi:glycosyltransferase [Paenibacillus sp. HW567]|uniref:glycosyltransferase n=1 Tax=Paenibacillus sp. HW567 TaxID=1034769 RepID=UPI000683FFDB|nr:glycosyltransferase [Paenibacillus sp. HW567]